MKMGKAEDINILGQFCGRRDIEYLSAENLRRRYGIEQADVMVLFGGSILCGGDVLAQAMKDRIARTYIIVGGVGHTTESLRRRVHQEYPSIQTEGLSEAEIFQQYVKQRHGLTADFLECRSTNCGNNITYLLELLGEKEIDFQSIILSQDATMQYRMKACLQKYVSDTVEIINYATYQAKVVEESGRLVYASALYGMWDVDRYVNLLMGEIPRLMDNENGYGPKGKGFIAHVDIPDAVLAAFEELRTQYGADVREANPLFGGA